MKHDKKREQQLEGELGRLRQRVAELERSHGDYKLHPRGAAFPFTRGGEGIDSP